MIAPDAPFEGQSAERLSAYRRYLKHIAVASLSSRYHRRIDPSDVVQQSLLLAYASRKQFRGNTELERRGWLRRILVRTILRSIRDLRARCRDHRREQEEVQGVGTGSRQAIEFLASPMPTPSETYRKKESVVEMLQVMQRLPERERRVIQLRYWQQLPLREIAVEMETTVPKVASLLNHALKRMRRRK
ncbi:sigma-70 family RNA polymerase sigma factor [Pirellulaceae bacterium SH467]